MSKADLLMAPSWKQKNEAEAALTDQGYMGQGEETSCQGAFMYSTVLPTPQRPQWKQTGPDNDY